MKAQRLDTLLFWLPRLAWNFEEILQALERRLWSSLGPLTNWFWLEKITGVLHRL